MTAYGLLLVNLGTPDTPSPKDVFRYLNEFLTDGRVIDVPWLWRQLLVRGMIVPFRYRNTARSYQAIWTDQGSPLKVYGCKVRDALQEKLGGRCLVELAMRYQNPSIEKGLANLIQAGAQKLVVLPLFPQYASATTGSVHAKVMKTLSRYEVTPQVTLVQSYPDHPALIEAFSVIGKSYHPHSYDHILFSFHGLPQKHLRKADRQNWCLQKGDCCQKVGTQNHACYSAHCYATAKGIAKQLDIPKQNYTISFQSRLGKDPWIQPYTSPTIAQLASRGVKKLLVFCPSFVCDCLETIYEVKVEYAHEFKEAGGEQLDLVQGLNDHEVWINALEQIVGEYF